ncbi:MAG: hypothetical protein Q4D19_04920 [Lautropia sp.]|nr:hypothetical protein [Lautropia sp.]
MISLNMMTAYRPNATPPPLAMAFLATATSFIALAAIGCYLSWSPVPIGDMWNGYLGFYVKTSNGDLSGWWAQHNEHRILLARIFFWLDVAIFEGKGWFLLLVNHMLMVCIGLTILQIWRARSRELTTTGGTDWAVGFFLVALVCSWIQHDNLTWGFQSQFFLAQWLPLLAFFLLHCAHVSVRRGLALFIGSALCGVAALGSMANGVITLPLLTVFALLLRMSRSRVLTLAMLSLAGLWLYFHGYTAPGGHGSLGKALRETPWELMEYMLAYIGSPIYYLAGTGDNGVLAAQIAGGILVLGSIITIPALRSPRASSLTLAMLFFLLYIGGTALATAGGRLIFGISQAVTSRYTTPALIAWAALLIASAPWWHSGRLCSRWRAIAMIAILVPFAQYQWHATEPRQDELFQRDVAALALELRIPDKAQIDHVFPFTEWAMRIAKTPSARNLSLFGLEPWVDLFEQLDKPFDRAEGQLPGNHCQGYLDEVTPIPGMPDMLRVRGWIHDAKAHAALPDDGPHAAHDPAVKRWALLDDRGQVMGFAFSGASRPDVAAAISPAAIRAGYLGYVRTRTAGSVIRFERAGTSCTLKVTVPAPPPARDGH